MNKYLVSADCIERFLVKTQNVKDVNGKHVYIAVMDLSNEMMKWSIDFDYLVDIVAKINGLARQGSKDAEKKIDSDLFEEIASKSYELTEALTKPEVEDVEFIRLMDETTQKLNSLCIGCPGRSR